MVLTHGGQLWRQIVTLLGPRSGARLHNMHKAVTSPAAPRRLTDVIHDLEKWESKLAEYYRCGGYQLSNKTVFLTAFDMLPSGTNPSLRMAIQTARTYEELKVTLHKTITYLQDHGALGGLSARVLADFLAPGDSTATSALPAAQLCKRWPGNADIQEWEGPGGEGAEGALAEDSCAMIMSMYAQRRSGGSCPAPGGQSGMRET